MSARTRYLEFRRTQAAPPKLVRRDVEVRGLRFATWSSPPVDGALPLLCINGGLLFDHGLLWPALAPLAQKQQIILYDQRGRGESSVPPGLAASRIEFDAGDAVALRSALGIEKWNVLGHSWGGGIALLATSMDPDAVGKLVLANAVGLTSSWLHGLHEAGIYRLKSLGSHIAAERLAALNTDELSLPNLDVHADYAQAFFPAWFADKEFAEKVVPPRGKSLAGAFTAARLRAQGYDWRDRASVLKCPVLVLHGDSDVLPIETASETVNTLSSHGVNARFVPLQGSGHNPFWEAASDFFSAVNLFLSEKQSP